MLDVLEAKLDKAVERYAHRRQSEGKRHPAHLTSDVHIKYELSLCDDGNFQGIPKKLHARLQKIAKDHLLMAITHPEPWIRNLLKPFEWGYAPDVHPTPREEERMDAARIEVLEKMSTGKLLKEIRLSSRGWSQFSHAEVKSVLNKRPHVPNKREGLVNRLKLIKKSRGADRQPAQKPKGAHNVR